MRAPFVVLLVAAISACASAGRTPARPRVSVACPGAQSAPASLFCGARPGGPSAPLCALPGRTARRAFLGGEIGARLADSSIIQANATVDSATFLAMVSGDADDSDPCAMQLLGVSRTFATTPDFDLAIARVTAVAAALDPAGSATVRCGLRDQPRLPFLYRMDLTRDSTSTFIDLSSYHSTDSAEVLKYAAEQRYLATLKIDLTQRPAPGANIGIVRTRYATYVRQHRKFDGDGPFSLYEAVGVDAGAVACERLARTALLRMRDAK